MISFEVIGTPAPKGSFRVSAGRGRTRSGKQRMVVRSDSPRTDAWETAVGWAAKQAMRNRAPLTGPLQVRVAFYLPRPKSVKRAEPCVKPDIDKLLRSTLDACTGLVWIDDAQVVVLIGHKHYADGHMPCAHINVIDLDAAASPLESP